MTFNRFFFFLEGRKYIDVRVVGRGKNVRIGERSITINELREKVSMNSIFFIKHPSILFPLSLPEKCASVSVLLPQGPFCPLWL